MPTTPTKTPPGRTQLCPIFLLLFPRLPPENTQSHQNSNKFTTSQSSQNISKTQRFSHAAKNEKKFSKLDCSLFFETAKNNLFPNQKHDFHEFQKGPKHKQNAYISQSSHDDKNMLRPRRRRYRRRRRRHMTISDATVSTSLLHFFVNGGSRGAS